MPTQNNDEDNESKGKCKAKANYDKDMHSLSGVEQSLGSLFLPTDVDDGEEEEEVHVTPGQTHMPTLSPLTEPGRLTRCHGESKKPGTHDDVSASSQSTLSDDETVGTPTNPATPRPPSEVTSITQSPCVGAALSEKDKDMRVNVSMGYIGCNTIG
jgi:hypothetical protein